jgi:phage terminase large subunit-like protein
LLLAQRLEREHSIPVETFAQTNALMCPAAAILREHIRAGTVRAGAARVVEEQVLNAIEAPRDPQGWRISKSTREEKIDIPIAMAMAAFLLETTDEVPSFAETGIYSIQL